MNDATPGVAAPVPPEPLLKPTREPGRSTVSPEQNVLLGAWTIMRYIGIKNILTLYKWVDQFAFPAIKRPDGLWMSTCTSIDTWIFLTADLDYKNRAFNRGTGNSPEADLRATRELPDDNPRRRRAMNRYRQWLEVQGQGGTRLPGGPKPFHRFSDEDVGMTREVWDLGKVIPSDYTEERDDE